MYSLALTEPVKQKNNQVCVRYNPYIPMKHAKELDFYQIEIFALYWLQLVLDEMFQVLNISHIPTTELAYDFFKTGNCRSMVPEYSRYIGLLWLPGLMAHQL